MSERSGWRSVRRGLKLSSREVRGGMVRFPVQIVARVGRSILLMIFAAGGTILLVRFAPGYFSDDREMDAKYARAAQSELWADNGQRSSGAIAIDLAKGWLSGDLGQSRQFGVPVTELLGARVRVSAMLLVEGIAGGWLLAICGALPVSGLRKGKSIFGLPFTILLAIPTAAMATACILCEKGGPVLVFS